MVISIDLTESQWCEVANAVASKVVRVRNGDYGDEDHADGFDPEAWAEELESAYNRIADELQKKGVAY